MGVETVSGWQPEPIYSWERRPEYAWNNEFARIIGRLLTILPRRYHIFAHNLAGQATLISHCIAMAHRDTAPGIVVPPAELEAYRFIGCHTTTTVEGLLDDLSAATKLAKQEIAQGKSLMQRIREQFEICVDGAESTSQVRH
jgi:hypothetical protein